MEDMAEVHIATHQSNLSQLLEELNPDIVHIHTCWKYSASQFLRSVVNKSIAVIISPHWQLSLYTMHNEQHIRKIIKQKIYQYQMIQKADALLATSDDEYQSLMEIGWKRRIGVVHSSILNNTITTEEMAEKILLFYKKVLDTRYFHFMTKNEKEAICSLLRVGIMQDKSRTFLNSKKIINLRTLNPEQWRRILLYADDEDIRDLIEKGIQTMQLDIPNIKTKEIDRFKTIHPKASGNLETENKNVKKNQEVGNWDEPLRKIISMLLNAQIHQKRQTLSMRHAAELYKAIKYEDYDEDAFAIIVKQLGLKKFTERMLQILSEDFYMEEGFMPIKLRNDKGTEKIRQIIIH
ncbi:MAG: glycosyltransferase [Prevotella sp.]|nr:glycosyltransferase [Prevotella sp.]